MKALKDLAKMPKMDMGMIEMLLPLEVNMNLKLRIFKGRDKHIYIKIIEFNPLDMEKK